jgi:glycosyltransferase involved in cell wall biosynthesis
MRSVAVFSNAPVGGSMSSPAIRAQEVARGLSNEFDVHLLAPGSRTGEWDGVRVDAVPTFAPVPLTRSLQRFDAVVAQKLPIGVLRRLAHSSTRLIYDLYTPALAESVVALDVAGADAPTRRIASLEATWQQLGLTTANCFVCPGERQRDFWLGMLADTGRIDLDIYRIDPTLRSLIDVVPFGIPDEPPVATARVLRERLQGIGEHDFVLLWSGGIVNSTDPATVVRAVASLIERRPEVKLVFLGFRPPQGAPPAEALRVRELAAELRVLDRSVFFHDEWVPYDDRHGFLLEADAGVAAYKETFENRLAFRARLLDYFWASLPTLTTRGDELGELVHERGLGRALAPGDIAGWTTAIDELAGGDDVRARIRANLGPIREELRWNRCLEPLRRMVREPGTRVPPSRVKRRLERRLVRGRARLWLDRLRGP